ncbi:MAG: hypothetical protein FJX59_05070 [Alphaproteobacteria bacterium]|nr:hypothetical protein [Alphaproteobacteria bacterium]
MDALSSPANAFFGQAQDTLAIARQARAAGDAKAATIENAREAAKGFEAFFIGQMMQHMWTDLDVNPEFGGGHGEQMWRSMLIDEYGKEIAKSGGLGIADKVMAEMLRAQEQRDAADTKLAEMSQPAEGADADGAPHIAAAVAVGAQVRR